MFNIQYFTVWIRPMGRTAYLTELVLFSGLNLNLSFFFFFSSVSHTEHLFLQPLNTPPKKTNTCYMSAGTSDKTEGLDWDKVQRPQSTFRCWVLIDVNWSCWFTRQYFTAVTSLHQKCLWHNGWAQNVFNSCCKRWITFSEIVCFVTEP